MSFDQRRSVQLFCLVFLVVTASVVVRAEELPDGQPGAISDWALAGVVWSDACLAKKVAKTAVQQTEDQDRRARYQMIAGEAEQLIQAMEQFGWKQVSRASRPDPGSVAGPVRQRIDTESPAGRDDPGLDDERVPEKTRLDIDQYRVDDYIDETQAEAINRADALEDGVEGAIAAASPDGIRGPVAGHISRREGVTRAGTMPYTKDSIYDADDYDPDVDFFAQDPVISRPDRPEAVEPLQSTVIDEDTEIEDDVNLLNPDPTIDGEDELLADLRRSDRDRSGGQLSLYSNAERIRPADADWVQLRLMENQLRWQNLAGKPIGSETIRDVVNQVRISKQLTMQATENAMLKSALRR